MSSSRAALMSPLGPVRRAQKSFPTGNPDFSVMQAFPSGFTAAEANPFLMCDHFDAPSTGEITDPDVFPVGWHPHASFDLCSYLKFGTGRHADSMGNRGTYRSPGMQWISAGSGIEHAEGGATPLGERVMGFQIWINTPTESNKLAPRYGVVDPEEIPTLERDGARVRLLAGPDGDLKGPFSTVQRVQMVDFEVSSHGTYEHSIPAGLNNAILYCYEGSGKVNGVKLSQHQALRLDAEDDAVRGIKLAAGMQDFHVMLFAGERLEQPIVWRGPFVLESQEELQRVYREYQTGIFPPDTASWNYRKWSEFPEEKKAEILAAEAARDAAREAAKAKADL